MPAEPIHLDTTGAEWQGEGDVQIAFIDGNVAMRDARNPDGPELYFTPAEWKAFVLGARDGEFDLQPHEAEPEVLGVIALGREIDRIEREEGPEAAEAFLQAHADRHPFYKDLRAQLVADGKLGADVTTL